MDKDHLKMVGSSEDTLSRLHPLVRQIKDNSLVVILKCVDELFSHCDDLFFDLSSRAASNNEQNLYFESMRELRVKKHGVTNRFKQNIEQGFAALVTGKKVEPVTPENAAQDSLSLVQNDDLEQEVSINSMTQKARVNCQEPIYHLATRLDYLVTSMNVDETNNPLDPQQLCNDFANACKLFDIDIKARIIIYKQFERHVVSRFSNIYISANSLLVDAGILPNISSNVKHKAADLYNSGTEDADAEPETESRVADVDLDTLGLAYNLLEISNLFNAIRGSGLAMRNLPSFKNYSENPGPLLDSPDLLNALSRLQQQALTMTANPDQNLHALINETLTSVNPTAPQSINRTDEDVINLVAMFFDFVLDDPAVPVTIQAQIGRLQIPMLKVALRDPRFFSDGNHPARKLVNYMAANSIGWDDNSANDKDAFYKKIVSIVQNVNRNYVDSPEIFATELAGLREFVEKQQHKSELVEKRTAQSQEGQARTQKAKLTAQQTLFEKLEKCQLPEDISNFLVNDWMQVLMMTHLKNGEESPDWLDGVQLIDDLVWVCQRQLDIKSIERLEKIRPHLLNRIHDGLCKIVDTEETADERLAEIERTLKAVQMAGDPVPLTSLTAEQAISLGHTPGQGSKSWHEMTGMERQQAKYQALTYEFIKTADNLENGTWVNYDDPETHGQIRCKLAKRIEVTDSLLFVNRFGFKVMEKSRKEFAYDLQQNRASILENGNLFDRAMSNVIDQLKDAAAA